MKAICSPCGQKQGKNVSRVSTWHVGRCDYCDEDNQYVTNTRDLGLRDKIETSPELDRLARVMGIKDL